MIYNYEYDNVKFSLSLTPDKDDKEKTKITFHNYYIDKCQDITVSNDTLSYMIINMFFNN